MHSEEMFDLGGKLSLEQNTSGGLEIVNQTRLSLQGVGLIKKLDSGNLQVAWLGKLEPGAIRTVAWVNRSSTQSGGRLWPDERNQSPLTATKDPAELKGELNLRAIARPGGKTGKHAPRRDQIAGLDGYGLARLEDQSRRPAIAPRRIGRSPPRLRFRTIRLARMPIRPIIYEDRMADMTWRSKCTKVRNSNCTAHLNRIIIATTASGFIEVFNPDPSP